MSDMAFDPQQVKIAGLIGGGVIGGGWAVRLALHSINVKYYDPDKDAQRKINEIMANATRAWRKLTLAPPLPLGEITLVNSVEEAVRDADFIQESAPENPELKQKIMKQITQFARPDVPIGSSTSGISPTLFQTGAANPERIFVAHPFNPVYLLPLLELCPGQLTDKKLMARAGEFYKSLGFHPLVMEKEVSGFIADRLMEALWRESLHMINENEATVEQLDDAIRYGCGLRWAFMGSFLTFRIAGGEAGMRHFMAQFGPCLEWDWTRLVAPKLTDDLLDKIVNQSDHYHGNYPLRQMEAKRDDCLVAIMQALKANDFASGQTLKDHEKTLYKRANAHTELAHDESQPLQLFKGVVIPEWVDYNNHLTESRYLQIFGDTTDAILRYIGLDEDYLAGGNSFYTVETHLCHLRECKVGEGFAVTSQILQADSKKFIVFHTMYNQQNQVSATAEHVLLHVDNNAAKACPIKDRILAKLNPLTQKHSLLPRPERAGRRIG